MKEIKAFVRSSSVDKVVKALEAAGAPGITVLRVHGVGYGYEPEYFSLAPRDIGRVPQEVKIEVVCAARDADRLVQAIVEVASTGSPGDGIVFVSPVERAVRIRSGEDGPGVLVPRVRK
jgi:nitrogen regulatory protein P-II 1